MAAKPSLTVKIRRSDGKTEEVTLADAIAIYERRRDEAKDEIERLHCDNRIDQLRVKWKKALSGQVKKSTATMKLKKK